jgi:hypothetical protein
LITMSLVVAARVVTANRDTKRKRVRCQAFIHESVGKIVAKLP